MEPHVGEQSVPRPGLRRVLRRVLGIPVLLLAGLLIVRWTSLAESRVFYVPTREAFTTPSGMEDVSIPSSDGMVLHAWFIRPKAPPANNASGQRFPAVLHCHGNAGNVSMHVEYSEFLADHGIAVLIFDYRGYGRSSPASGLTRNALMEDARAAMAYLKARPEVDPERIGVMGVSLGGVFASRLAVKDASVKALCTVAAFSSWRGIAGDHLPVIGPLILPGGLDPADSVRSARKGLPMLLVHGDRDEIVPVRHAGVLEAAAREAGLDVTTLIVEGASHNSVMFTNQGEQQAVGDFFARALGVPGVEGSPRR